jgi:DNA-binding IclR family transcriptional regulator
MMQHLLRRPSSYKYCMMQTRRHTIDTNKSATALRALKVLEALAQSRDALSAAEVAGIIGAERTTAYRMLMTLMEAGYVMRDQRARAYRLGYKVLTLSRAILSGDEKSALVAACLREISASTGEAAHYSVLERDCAVLVQRSTGTQLVTIDFQVGDCAPLHCTSIGKVLLAYQDSAAIEAAIHAGLPRLARNTITDPKHLRTELRKVRAQGYAYDDMEFADDMRCVAVPVVEKDGRVISGISLSGPASRYSRQKLRELRNCAMAAGRELSLSLGGNVADGDEKPWSMKRLRQT